MTQKSQAGGDLSAGHFSIDQLSAFVDGELSPDEMERTEQHLIDCHPCALRVLSVTQLKAATASAGRSVAAPPEALARLAAQLRQQPAKAAVLSFRPILWAAIAATIALVISLIGWRQAHEASTISAELLDQHLAALSGGASPEVISTDRHTVKPWFQGKLPFSFNLPEVLPADTTLKGGDLTYLRGQPAAMLLFNIHKHEVSVFLTPRSNSLAAPGLSASRSGFTIRYATTPELRIAAVSDVNPSDIDRLVAALVQAQSPDR